MTKQEKELLLNDICARLPYGVKASFYGVEEECECVDTIEGIYPFDNEISIGQYALKVETIKPYLFPMSSMTEWQERELEMLMKNSIESCGMLTPYDCLEMERFFNENHLDWRGLIPMGLANDATGLNIY